jgi:hypothetical protein
VKELITGMQFMKKPKSKRFLGFTCSQIGILAGLGVVAISIIGCLAFLLLFNSRPASTPNTTASPLPPSNSTTGKILSAADTFEVSSINVVEDEGYTVTSAVCEVVSPERFTVEGYDFGKIVFHAFRITKPTLVTDAVVLFASNHTASDGSGLVQNVNPLAKTLFPDFPDGARLKHPITTDTPGAQEALDCASQAGAPPPLDFGNFNAEEWRQKTIEKFGSEQTFDDGSKQDYVQLALSICKYKESHPSMVYETGSFQQYVLDTFCPYAK